MLRRRAHRWDPRVLNHSVQFRHRRGVSHGFDFLTIVGGVVTVVPVHALERSLQGRELSSRSASGVDVHSLLPDRASDVQETSDT